MNNVVKTNFSIKDLEGLSGIKAHTIRIWEKRYNLLAPIRTATNIRTYALADLQKLLNVTFLIQNGYKISKIAKNTTQEIAQITAEIVSERSFSDHSHATNSFKIAMMNFDQELFYKTYNTLLEKGTFESIFYETFLPLLHEIGLLWQTDTINPSHEHFIYNLIKQKLLINIEKAQANTVHMHNETFVLYLPENEIHELGLIFLNYELVSHGFKVIYLGQSIQLDSLKYLSVNHPNITFVSYFTVYPLVENLENYMQEYNEMFGEANHKLYIFGQRIKDINEDKLPNNIRIMLSIREFVNTIKRRSPSYA